MPNIQVLSLHVDLHLNVFVNSEFQNILMLVKFFMAMGDYVFEMSLQNFFVSNYKCKDILFYAS